MSEPYSHPHGVADEQDDYQPELSNIPQTGIYNERVVENLNSYIRISGREEIIDEQGILEEFHNRRAEQQNQKSKQKQQDKVKTGKKIKPPKLRQAPSKKYDFGYIKKKWKADIDFNIQKYKEYLKQEKQAYDFKEKEFMLNFFKVLLDGIFELKDHAQSEFNDLTNNERKIIAQESDYFSWLRDTVNNFDKDFKEAKYNQKIQSTANKWKPLIKNCMDENNFELRRKIIRWKIKPINVIENNDAYLMSEEAKLQEERLKKLILAEADKNFEKPIDQEENVVDQSFDNKVIADIPDQLESIRSISVNENFEKKINQERQKLEQYKQSIGHENILRLYQRIEQLLKGTSSYDSIMQDFVETFSFK